METAYKLENEKIKITKYGKSSYAIDFEKGKHILWLNDKEMMLLRDRISEALDPPEEDDGVDILREKDDYIDEIGNGKDFKKEQIGVGDENDGEI